VRAAISVPFASIQAGSGNGSASWRRNEVFQIARRHAEHTLDAFEISDADLNVRFFAKAGVLIDRIALLKDASDGIERGQVAGRSAAVQVIDHGAIQVAHQAIRATFVRWKSPVLTTAKPNETFVACLEGAYSHGRREIKAKPQVDYRTDNRRIIDGPLCLPGICLEFIGVLDATKGVRLPKIGAGAQPVPFVGVVAKVIARDQGFGDRAIAAMIAKDEGGREFVQLLAGRFFPTIELRKLAVFG
jgi:hypothetical protein